MHEYSLARGIIQVALRHAEGRQVLAVGLRVGPLRQVVPDTLAFAFELTARGTLCEGARLEQELVPCRLRCPTCELEWTATEPDFRCRECGFPAAVLSGDELLIEWVTVDDAVRER
ncbi:MAG: hydrogenase maturation nickel metallochaperone HypA [Solirubrobacteraceae bacterium]